METPCPKCSQRLRVPDHLKNPLLRCPNCRETFRLGLDEQLYRGRENHSRENHSRESHSREKSSREKSSREKSSREKSSREKSSRESHTQSSSPSGTVRSTVFPSIPPSNLSSREKTSATSSPEARLPDTSAEEDYQEYLSNLPQSRVPTAKPSQQWSAGIAGWVIALVVFLLLNGGPRIAKHFMGKRPHKNEPAQMKDHQRQAIDQAIRNMEQKIAEDRANRGRHPMRAPQPASERGPTD